VHEINQPLAAIAANANAGLRWLAASPPNLDEARTAFKRIVNDSHRAHEVIDGIRLMFQADGPARSLLDVNNLVREIFTLIGGDIEHHRISVRTELAERLPKIPANLVQLRQVLVNLVTNAVDAMDNVGSGHRLLRIKTELRNKHHLLIAVEDSGMGIDPRNVDSIFEPFFTTKSHGMGMGLSICRSIIENHGGHLAVVPAEPHGSVFQVFLPIDPSP
jgi:signal transduction histidine kinase